MNSHSLNPPNHLANASSPYLQQHANNPVQWHEWGKEALDKAKAENKPLLISIGYSACHWCHVMAHEVFENEESAVIMNAHFINIKIDREERPDIDQIYMDAIQLINGRGGWPLNIFALPDGRPFHGGTYFPLKDWNTVVTQLNDLWMKSPSVIYEYATKLTEGLKANQNLNVQKSEWTESDFQTAINTFKSRWDLDWGGFKGAPKFPLPVVYKFAMHYDHLYNDAEVRNWVVLSLNRMSLGGLYDTVGGAYSRYSVDEKWHAPHFEKMLYDNGQLLSLLADTFMLTQDAFFVVKIKETHQFIVDEWQSAEGGLYSALDADSEGEEGKYYCYTWDDLTRMDLPSERILKYFKLTQIGNWEHHKNILFATQTPQEFAQAEKIPMALFEKELQAFLNTLKKEREGRIKPGLDDKILTSWNALAATGLLKCYAATSETHYLATAEKILDFIQQFLHVEGHLFRNYKNGKAVIPAFLEDYVLYAEALTAAYQLTFKEDYLLKAHEVICHVLQNFGQTDSPFYLFNADQEGELFVKKTDLGDDVIPSANSVLCELLIKHSYYFDKREWLTMANNMLQSIHSKALKGPAWYSNWLSAAMLINLGLNQVTIVGHSNACIFGNYWPNTIFVGESKSIPLAASKFGAQSGYYVCTNFECLAPLFTTEALKEKLY